MHNSKNRANKAYTLRFSKKKVSYKKHNLGTLFAIKYYPVLGEKRFIYSFSASVFKKAVDRNLVKRRVKYYIIQKLSLFKDGVYYVYLSKNLVNIPTYEEISTVFDKFLSEIHS